MKGSLISEFHILNMNRKNLFLVKVTILQSHNYIRIYIDFLNVIVFIPATDHVFTTLCYLTNYCGWHKHFWFYQSDTNCFKPNFIRIINSFWLIFNSFLDFILCLRSNLTAFPKNKYNFFF